MKKIEKCKNFIKKTINYLKGKRSDFINRKQIKRVKPWFEIDGDNTLRLDYNLNRDSIVVDVGGYEGKWANEIYKKYNCNIFIFEPIKEYYDKIVERFKENPKIRVYNYGLSNEDCDKQISLLNDSSSLFKKSRNLQKITLVNASNFFNSEKIDKIELIKINIEGGEYDLLENLIENGLVSKIINIQVQFHDFVKRAKKRMLKIEDQLSKTHHPTYRFEFVWENWEIN
jgi:FkbM family methyltransferase